MKIVKDRYAACICVLALSLPGFGCEAPQEVLVLSKPDAAARTYAVQSVDAGAPSGNQDPLSASGCAMACWRLAGCGYLLQREVPYCVTDCKALASNCPVQRPGFVYDEALLCSGIADCVQMGACVDEVHVTCGG